MNEFRGLGNKRWHDQNGRSDHVADLAANSVPWDAYFAEFNRTYGNPYEAWLEWRRRQELPTVRDHRPSWAAIARQDVGTKDEEALFTVALVYDDDGFPLIGERADFPAKRGNPEIIKVLAELGIRPPRASSWSRQTIKDILKRLWRAKWHRQIDESSHISAERREAAKVQADQIIAQAFKERRKFTRGPCKKPDCRCAICKGKRKRAEIEARAATPTPAAIRTSAGRMDVREGGGARDLGMS